MKIVIADASCLITLDNIDESDLLPKLYKQVLVTPEVAAEVGDSLPNWVVQRSSLNISLIKQLTANLEIGEATSIALALETPECILVIDEKKGRRFAVELGLEITGTIGIIIDAIDKGKIGFPETVLDRLELAGFRFSETLKSKIRSRIH